MMSFQGPPLDVIGIGFGPAAIAVAVAIEDATEPPGVGVCAPAALRVQFLERGGSSAWQPSMLLPGTDIQHHFLRDFATPRNPRSRFTFPCYLVDTGRLYPFTLMGGYVSRQEWSEYVEWVAARISLPVRYDSEVVDVTPVMRDGRVVAALVRSRHTRSGEVTEHLARNVLVSTGHQPHVPGKFAMVLGDRVFHSAEFLPRVAAWPAEGPQRIAVVGAGQNAGEIILHIANAYPKAVIYSLTRNSGFRTYNLGHFSNEAYFPAETDYFYGLDRSSRERVFAEVHSTNYASVDPDVSFAMYRLAYEDRHWGHGRLHMRKWTVVESCAVTPGGLQLKLRELNTATSDELEVDAIVLCTGFREPRLPAVLEPFRPYVELDDVGDPVVDRTFRLSVTADCEVGLYLNGVTEWRHGINTATSFSTLAIRAGEILRDIDTRRDSAGATDFSSTSTSHNEPFPA